MSGLQRPGGTTSGTAVDPVSPGGVLIDPSEITQPGGPYPAGFVLETDGSGGWVIVASGATARSIDIGFHHQNGVPASGTRFLRFGDRIISSQTGFRLPSTAATLVGLSIQVQNLSTNTYRFDLLDDPAGRAAGPTAIGGASLVLPASTLFVRDRTLSVAIGDIEIGARMVRTLGAGGGLGQIIVWAEFELAAP